MEPLRKCQTARQFIRVYSNAADYMLAPCEDYPNCPDCPMDLSETRAINAASLSLPCPRCHAQRMTLYDVESSRLLVPNVSFSDFTKALGRSHSSVAVEELDRFVKWTQDFGQEG
jgi:hypothetical protein